MWTIFDMELNSLTWLAVYETEHVKFNKKTGVCQRVDHMKSHGSKCKYGSIYHDSTHPK